MISKTIKCLYHTSPHKLMDHHGGLGLKCSKSHKQWMSAVKQYLLYTIGGAFVHELTESVTADTDLCMIKSDKILAWMGKGFLKSHPLAEELLERWFLGNGWKVCFHCPANNPMLLYLLSVLHEFRGFKNRLIKLRG